MKKIFTLMAAFAATLAASAASNIQLYFGDKLCVDGDSYEIGYSVFSTDEEDGIVYTMYMQDTDLFIAGPNSATAVVEVKADMAGLGFCWPSTCEALEANTVLTHESTVSATKKPLEIHSLSMKEVEGDAVRVFATSPTVTVTAYEKGSSDKITVTVKLLTTAGVKNQIADSDYVKAIGGKTISYNVHQPATLSIYAITGNLVAKYPIANSGQVNVGNLGKGLYVYTTGRISGKILIK